MRKPFSTQRRFDACGIPDVVLNFDCRDSMVPVLAALQHMYSTPHLRDEILKLIAADVNCDSRDDRGREGLDYWHILVLQSVRLGCNLTYDQLHDLAENHLNMRAVMGLGTYDETSFNFRRIRDNLCQLRPETIAAISDAIVSEGHRMNPEAAKAARVDSFVVDTCIHYPTESSLIRDGVRKILELCARMAEEADVEGWRQHAHLWKKIKRLARNCERIAAKKGANSKERLKKAYQKLLKLSRKIVARARELCDTLGLDAATPDDVFGKHTLQAFIARTEHVQRTAKQRVVLGNRVENNDKLFSMFEPHTQLYKRGKAGEPIQFGRLVLVFEDASGFITHHYVMARDERDADVAEEQLKIVQQKLGGRIERVSFDRGFHSPENQQRLPKIVAQVCLPKPGKRQAAAQEAEADEAFFAARQNHPGVESAIGALQSGNGLERCRDRSERGFERYVALGILGRNLHTLGKLLIAAQSPDSAAATTRRAA